MKVATYLRKIADKRHPGQVRIHDCGNGHVQIYGPLLVNYYPDSRKKTAYIGGTKVGIHGVSPEQALSLAFRAPAVTESPDQRGRQRSARKRLLKKAACISGKYKCMWCPGLFPKDDLTVEHIIPLARGGLDNDNNKGLACRPCNQARGHDMPELQTRREEANAT